MPVFRVVRKSDQVEVTRYAASAVVSDGYPLDEFDHIEFDPEATTPPPVQSRITRLAFRNRFTQAEKVAIEIAALDNPAAMMEQRVMSATLRASQQDVAAAQYIDLDRPDTRAGVQMLEQAGLIASGRAAVILDTPPTDAEVYRV